VVEQAAHRAATVGNRVRRRIRRFLAGLGISTLGAALLAVLAVVLVLRFYGLPPQAKHYLLRELEARGVTASVGRLLLSPSGDVIAERVSVYRSPARDALLLQVDHVRLGIGWFSWWRGQPFLRDAEVSNASINLPLTDKTTVSLNQVNAQVEFNSGGLAIRSASARVLNALLELRGSVLLTGPFPPGPARKDDPQSRAAIDALARRIVAFSDDLDTQHPIRIQVDFAVASATPQDATAHVTVGAHYVRWRGALIDEISAEAALTGGVATLSDLHIRLARGELTATGEADLAKKRANLEFSSTLDFTPLAVAFPGHVGEALGKLSFTELPSLTGRADAAWGQEGSAPMTESGSSSPASNSPPGTARAPARPTSSTTPPTRPSPPSAPRSTPPSTSPPSTAWAAPASIASWKASASTAPDPPPTSSSPAPRSDRKTSPSGAT
jgi:hypothetical protein